MVNRWRISLLPLLFFLFWGSCAQAATIIAVADRDRIAVGESLQLQLRVDGSPDGEPDLSGLEQKWEILSRSQSSQMQVINGSFSRSVVYSLTLMPRAQGTLLIPAVCFAKDCSLPLPIEVSDTAGSGRADETLLLETEVSPQKIVTQGQLLFRVRLLRRVDLLDGQLNEPQPTGVSAVVKKLGDDRSYETRRNGRLYQVIERTYAIFPQGTGVMQIPALQFDGSIGAGRTRLDPFGQQRRRVRRTSLPLQVEVTPLPKDIGRRPWIPAIAVELQDDWQQHPPKLTVGEPATRTLRLGATGVQAAQLPELNPEVPDGFKTYPDQPKRDDLQSSSGISGLLEQKIVIVPTRAGHFTLPPVDLDWWDVTTGRWKSVRLAALDLEVVAAPGPEPSALPSATLPALKPVGTEPAMDNLLSDASAQVPPPSEKTVAGFWPWLSLGLGLGWLLTLLLLWHSRRSGKPIPAQVGLDLQLSEKAARRAVVLAARNNDPQATRQSLRTWSRILWPSSHIDAYEELHKTADPLMRAELETLDRCLYGRSKVVWDGQAMVTCLISWRPDSFKKIRISLPELYPEKK